VRTPKILVLDRAEGVAEQVQDVAEELVPRPEVVICSRIGTVGDVLTDAGPFDVLVAGPSMGTRSGMARLQIIHDELPELVMVLALSRRPDAGLRDIVRTGASDLVQLPAEDKEMIDTLQRAVELAGKLAKPAAPAPVAAPVPAAPHHAGPGRVFTISSATGGCGKTFYATNLAYFLARHAEGRAAIVDLDLQFGEVVTAMRLRPRYTIFDALQRDDTDEADLHAHIEEYMVEHETGVHVLAAPREPSEADRINPPDVTRIIDAVRSRFDYVIVDTPPALTEVVLAAFDLSDQLYVMATLDLPSVRNMSVFLQTLERLRIPADNVRLILNKAESDVGIDIDQVTKLFPQGFEAVLPYAKEVSRSINLGMPVMAASPQAPVSRGLFKAMGPLLPEPARALLDAEADAKTPGFFARLLGRTNDPSTSPS